MKREMTCISCPVGCRLTVTTDGDKIIVEGNQCKRGAVYAENEVRNPSRTVTSTVSIEGALLKSLPVKTDEPVPKGKSFETMKAINALHVQAPVEMGDILIPHVAGTDSNIVATRSLERLS